MSADTITNFIKGTYDVMEYARKTLYDSKKYHKVMVYAGDSFADLWKTLSSAPSGTAVVAYTGSQYGQKPRRTIKFSVVVVVRKMISDQKAQENVMALIDDTLSLLDHVVYDSQVIFKVIGDSWLEYGNATVSAYKVDFIGEDY